MEYYTAIKRNGSTDTSDNKDESWKHYDVWKKPITKDHKLYDFTHDEMPRIGKCTEPQSKPVLPRAGKKGGLGEIYRVSFCCEENVLKFIPMLVAQLCITKNQCTVHFKRVNCICESQPNDKVLCGKKKTQ